MNFLIFRSIIFKIFLLKCDDLFISILYITTIILKTITRITHLQYKALSRVILLSFYTSTRILININVARSREDNLSFLDITAKVCQVNYILIRKWTRFQFLIFSKTLSLVYYIKFYIIKNF